MGKCFIDFSVIQQDLRRTDKNTVAADAAETVAARFYLASKWDGLNVYARFQHGPEVYDVPLVDGCATIPHEVLRETGFNVSIFGEDASGARLTSARVFVDVEPTISNDGAPPIPATPSLLQRIEALVHASSENANNAASNANNAASAANTAKANADAATSNANAAASAANTASSNANAAAAAANGAANDATAAAHNALNIANSIAAIEPPSDDEVKELRDANAVLATAVAELQDDYVIIKETAYMPASRRSALSGETLTVAQASMSSETATLN